MVQKIVVPEEAPAFASSVLNLFSEPASGQRLELSTVEVDLRPDDVVWRGFPSQTGRRHPEGPSHPCPRLYPFLHHPRPLSPILLASLLSPALTLSFTDALLYHPLCVVEPLQEAYFIRRIMLTC